MSERRSAMLGESGYERRSNDAYFTPAWCTEALLDRVRFRGLIWEPACGNGAICEVLDNRGYPFMASDIMDYGYPCSIADFLTHGSPGDGLFSIVTNPPYEHAESFIRQALNLTERAGGMVAMLLRHEYDCAASRKDLWEFPFSKKLVLTKRPRWSDNDRASPRHNFSWYLWDWHGSGKPPTLEWL